MSIEQLWARLVPLSAMVGRMTTVNADIEYCLQTGPPRSALWRAR